MAFDAGLSESSTGPDRIDWIAPKEADMKRAVQRFADMVRRLPMHAMLDYEGHGVNQDAIASALAGDEVLIASAWNDSNPGAPVDLVVESLNGVEFGHLRDSDLWSEDDSCMSAGDMLASVACLLPHLTARVDKVVPIALRHARAQHSIFIVRIELRDGSYERIEEDARALLAQPWDKRDSRSSVKGGMITMERQPLGLEERRERAIADLKKYYPDGRVERLDALHKHFSERLSRLYKELGYTSRREMIESFGFEVIINKGGRPISHNPEAVLSELQRRYEGRQKPATIKVLFEENSDIGGSLKTIYNEARKHFGRSFSKELEARGLIEKASAKSAPQQTGRAGRPRKPVPETAEILAALDDMERRVGDVPIEDRHSSMAGLRRRFPEYEGHVEEGRKQGVVSKEALQRRGILRPPKKKVSAERKRARLSHIRAQGLPFLLERYKSLNGPSLVTREHPRHFFEMAFWASTSQV